MLEINTKEDFIIPFEKIGDDQWIERTRIILEAIADNSYATLETPVSDSEIDILEQRLGTGIPTGLKLFYTTFGIADIGEILMDFDTIGRLSAIWANSSHGPSFTAKDQEYLPYLITFGDYLGNGNMFCFHEKTHEIYYFDHDSAPFLTKLFDTADDYIRSCLIFAQCEFCGEETDEEATEEWAEEIVGASVGAAVIEKWHY